MIRRPPRSTLDRSSAASDVYKRQVVIAEEVGAIVRTTPEEVVVGELGVVHVLEADLNLSLIHISEPTRPY